MPRIAVVGAGWAGLSASQALLTQGHEISLYEMAPAPGGRARSLATDGPGAPLDNGQHILIGAYTETLALMRDIGLSPADLLWRSPLQLTDAQGRGLRLPDWPAMPAFAAAVLQARHWPWPARLSLLRQALGWALSGFHCDDALTVRELCRDLHPAPLADLIDPLCVAALNTPADRASARVFLRVLKDALFAGPGSADLLLPRRPLAELLPAPALHALAAGGARLHLGRRAAVGPDGTGHWLLRTEGASERFDAVLLACPAAEAARQLGQIAPAWAAQAAALRYEPIVTVYLRGEGRLPFPMVALQESADAPAQFLFDHGPLGLEAGRFAAVVSGASAWLERGQGGTGACAQATLDQIGKQVPQLRGLQLERVVAEKRATFACTPGLKRPAPRIATGLWAAGDYIDGPYPATLEGAVRAGRQAARGLMEELAVVAPGATP